MQLRFPLIGVLLRAYGLDFFDEPTLYLLVKAIVIYDPLQLLNQLERGVLILQENCLVQHSEKLDLIK
jgi:hypothetical protein